MSDPIIFTLDVSGMAPPGREWFVSVGRKSAGRTSYIAATIRRAGEGSTHCAQCTGRFCGFAAVGKSKEAVAEKVARHWRKSRENHPV